MNSSSATPAKGSKIKLYLIGIVVVLILGAVLYFVGLQAGKAQLSAQAAKFGVERNGLQSQLASAQSERDAALERASMMEARAALYRTAIDLDERNFGTANDHLQEAATSLSRAKSSDVAALQQEISATDLNVAVDLGAQRQKVLDFAEQLNAKMPAQSEPANSATNAPVPDGASNAPSADSSVAPSAP